MLLLLGWFLLLLLLRLLRLLLLFLLLPLLVLLLLLLLLSLLLCSEGIWSLKTLPPNSEQVLKGRDDFGRIRPNVFLLSGGGCLIKGVRD